MHIKEAILGVGKGRERERERGREREMGWGNEFLFHRNIAVVVMHFIFINLLIVK